MAKRAPRASAKPTPAKTPLLEWVTAAVGLVLIVGSVAVILADALSAERGPPAVVVEAVEIMPAAGGWLVRFEARNDGRDAAAEVQVTGVVRAGGAEIERRTVTLDYVPGGGRRRGALQFRDDPRAADLELVAEGYREP